MDPMKNTDSIAKEVRLLIRCLAIDVLWLREFACVGMSLPTHCLTTGTLCHILYLLEEHLLRVFICSLANSAVSDSDCRDVA
jgi:hypothetical protein